MRYTFAFTTQPTPGLHNGPPCACMGCRAAMERAMLQASKQLQIYQPQPPRYLGPAIVDPRRFRVTGTS